MKKSITILLMLTAAIQAASSFTRDQLARDVDDSSQNETVENRTEKPTELDPSVVEHIRTAYGIITTLHLATDETIQDLKFGSEIITYQYEADKNLLHLMPRIESGVTNMNMMIGGKVHVFIVHIESDPRVEYRRTFTMREDKVINETLNKAPILSPGDVPVVDMIRILERIDIDPSYGDTVPNLLHRPIGDVYDWNNCQIYFKDVWQFANLDTLVFRIQWQNDTNKLLHLNSRQYDLRVAGKKVPITASTQNREQIYPGEIDEVFLFVQGHRLEVENDWRLLLPPDEESVVRMFMEQ